MSRFEYDDDDDEWSEAKAMLWQANVKRALEGKRGQLALREFKEALEQMPEHRLIRDMLVTEEGEACAIGAFALHKRMKSGATREQALHDLMREWGDQPDGFETQQIGVEEIGLTHVLAWEIGYRNDEMYYKAFTPEQLWQHTYDWVCEHIS